ncbi:MAG: class II aldolase/adducin family protein [Clostridiales bacterium]|nr:class II aldolase/adducin family protein [Clostridiales bacterium]
MNYKRFVCESAYRMFKSGLTIETWGNISAKDPETGLIYITPSGMSYEVITPDDIVVVDKDLNIVEGTRKPSMETGMHVKIMNARPDVHAVLHTHPLDSQVFACLHRDIPPVIDEAAQILGGTVKCAKYALPGSPELANYVLEALGDGYACLMANHGAVCVGADMEAAFRVCNVLESTAKIYQRALAIGIPQPVAEKDMLFMKDYVVNHYGQDKD